MPVTRDQVRRIATLAHLEFEDHEYDRFTRQLNAILEFVAQLDRLDTSAVEATSHMESGTPALRDDRVLPSVPRDEALKNAPDSERGLFKVPKVIG
jgi:aspartyl-tRNA(Asn)/glutamyl-tRNA(Gln) amidotransferase subunit C